jgi:hypothetical protein
MYGSAADYFVYIGFLGLAIVFIMLMVFLGRRLLWLFGMLFGMSVGSPNYKAAIIKFLILMLTLCIFGVFTYINFFDRAYPQYEKDKVSAEVYLYASNNDYSSISISIPRGEKQKTLQGGSIQNDRYLLVGQILTPPDWMRNLGVKDGFRFYGLLKGVSEADYYNAPIDVNVSEKPNDFVWKILTAVLDIFPLADIETHIIRFQADGFNSRFNVYASKNGFKRE